MLDVRATNYITPLAEVPFTDVPLSVRLVNAGDEPAYITGLFRVYNDTTTELIFSSEIAPLLLTSGQSSAAPALTDFSPPAPADDTYFVKFDGFADNPIVPNRITLTLGAFHFDVKPGPLGDPPAAHAPTHEQAGADPIETSDLGTSEVDTTLRLAPDGAGGVLWNTAAAGGVTPHASSHEDGGADELEVTDLATSELDDTLVLAPDGAGGVEFRAEAGGGAPGGADSNVQYNNGGAFGGEASLSWDDVNKRLGVGTNAPTVDFDALAQAAADVSILARLGATTKTARVRVQNDTAVHGTLSMAGTTNPYSNFGVNRNTAVFLEASSGGLVLGTNASGPVTLGVNNTAYVTLLIGGLVGFGTTSPTAQVDLAGNILRIRTAKTPATAGAAGNQGDICWDADFLYVCVATNTWKKVAIATW